MLTGCGRSQNARQNVANPKLGTKRIDPETGQKFYDLNRDPIVSPYTGKSYPLSYFDSTAAAAREEEEEVETEELDVALEKPEFVSLEDADADSGEDVPDLGDDVDVEVEDSDDDDTFLAEDEEDEDDDVTDILGGGIGDDDEN
ncbi:TIGR02300 family protein [Phyllobacterium sp. CL33Tsu]|nr:MULTISPECIES: TIGR02300 family protein [Phyllobacterium]SFI72043.1 TIGR02300 family protein [Phyllobacterium sp. CL33Tsu]